MINNAGWIKVDSRVAKKQAPEAIFADLVFFFFRLKLLRRNIVGNHVDNFLWNNSSDIFLVKKNTDKKFRMITFIFRDYFTFHYKCMGEFIIFGFSK